MMWALRYVLTVALLLQIWWHAHWSVALFAGLVSIRFELQDAEW